MQDTIKAGTMLIQEGTLLLTGVPVESDAFLPGWRGVKNLDGHGLGRKIDEANWNFFCLAGEIKATAIGREGVEGLRRAVKQILAKRTGQKFNWLEITKVVSKRFLGIPFISVTAHSRHIQQGMGLVPAKDFVLRMPAAAAPESRLGGGGEQQHGEVATRQTTALISSS